jgi:hypothetical protein
MTETRKTLLFCGVAVVLSALAVLTAPRREPPAAFSDLGAPVFPRFTDPNAARTLEVFTFDEQTGQAVPFKVTFENGIWTIPSHHGYPADAKDRLAKTAANIIELKKDDFRSDNMSDHEACGVIDPLESVTTAATKGRGQRITIKGEGESLLADLIVGKPVENSKGMRFIRIPGQNRIYASRMNLDVSTKFEDWIEKDVLQASRDDLDKIVLSNYSIDERSGRVTERDRVVLLKHGEWTTDSLRPGEEIVKSTLDELLDALDDLKIEGVRPKPAGITASLSQSSQTVSITQADVLSLQDKGYFLSKDGKLLSNEGEVQVRTEEGLVYTLRFGEVVYGTGLAVTAGTPGGKDESGGAGENRYLFVTVAFDRSLFPEPADAPNKNFLTKADSLWTEEDRKMDEIHQVHERWARRMAATEKKTANLNSRFANWFYVISASSFEKLRPAKGDLIQKKKAS